MWGFLVLSVVPVVEALFNPVTAFNGAGGRLTADPTVISERAATVLLLALILHTVRKRMLLKLVCLISAAIMIAALGKTAIAAGLFAVAVYYALRKRVVAGLVLLGAVGVLAGVIYFAVPQVSRYFALYAGADTLTGRTNIWLNAIGQIKQRPIIGHGYLASRFMWVAERGRIAEVMHLHNGFLDVLYNLGLLGLIPMFLMHAILVRSIWRTMVLTRRPDAQSRLGNNQEMSLLHLLAVGCAALYVNLLINGLLGTTFGGRATAPFMLFLALLAIAEMIYCRAAQYAPVAATKAA
jgi:O-antigen ligase